KKSQKVMQDLKIKDLLEKFAEQNGYHNALDYVLCSLYPELEKECKKYYNYKGQQLMETHSRHDINKIDNVISQALLVFYKKKKEMEKEGENEKNTNIKP
ncbi:MAG TPA: hypothetical protein VMZ91_14220, partial [Candidatus Paceibacterota bacterium]|nr:hypothetical protein [Candidatus Paceibacterota bacterium]